ELTQIRPLDVRHGEIQHAVLLAGSEGPDDVGMVDARRELGFAQKAPAETIVLRQLGVKELEREAPAAVGVSGEVHTAGAAVADEGLDTKTGDDSPRLEQSGHPPKEA